MNRVKQILKSRLSREQLYFLRRSKANLRTHLDKVVTWPLIGFIRLLPLSMQLLVRERVLPIGRLDYVSFPALMCVDSRIQYKRLYSYAKEPWTVHWIEENLKPQDVFYDIGANVGAYSFVALAVTGSQAKIFAFEPGYSTYAALCKNISLNSADKSITPFPIALADNTEVARFVYSDTAPGAASHPGILKDQTNNQLTTSAFSHSTLCYRLDDLRLQFELEPPNLIKIDVDGSELGVLQGAEKTLKLPSVRSIFVEVDLGQPSFEMVFSFLGDCGYSQHGKFQHEDSTICDCVFLRQ